MVTHENKKERYSFSKLSSFNNCKHGYKLTYIDHQKGIGNCFSSYGTEIHSLMERYANGEIELWDLADVYEWEFDAAVPEEFPPSDFCKDKNGKKITMRELYYQQGLDFLKNFPGYDELKILEVESNFDVEIDDWIFTGVIDLVLEDKDGNLIIQDYKSKSSFKSKKEQSEYARQLYLYSLYIKEKYEKNPKLLRFMMFRKNQVVDIPFKEESLQEAVNWAKNTVQEIRDCWDFSPKCDEFFSEHLCNHREYCDNKI